MRPSTRAFLDEARRLPRFSLLDRLHGYVYLRWPYLYISVATGEHRLARPISRLLVWIGKVMPRRPSPPSDTPRVSFADTYHGKVVPLDAATQLVTVNRNIEIRNLEHVIPFALARDIVLQQPDRLVALECPCRAARKNPCQPLDVCLIVGEPFASFVTEHHPERSRRITPEEAIAILKAEDERGHVHHAFFKDVMLGRFYAICNCCACCCGAMQAHRHGTPMLASSGYLSQVDETRCLGCGDCAEICPFEAISVTDGLSRVDAARCMGCGICVGQCPQEALSLVRDPCKGEPLEIVKLLEGAASA